MQMYPRDSVTQISFKSQCWRAVVKLAIAVPTLLGSAHAAIVQQFIPNQNGTLVSMVFDGVSGLEWLTPLATIRRTFSEIEGGIGGWTAAGFRYATRDEMRGLISNAGVDTSNSASPYLIGSTRPNEVLVFQKLLNIWGASSISNPPGPNSPFGQQAVYGVFADAFLGDGQTPPSRVVGQLVATDTAGSVSMVDQWRFGTSDSQVGHFLVRGTTQPVSAPSTASLVAIALFIGTFWLRSKKTLTPL